MPNDPFELEQPFLKLGDRVILHQPDGDGHVYTKDVKGTIETIIDRHQIEVVWDDDEKEWLTEDDLVLE